MSLLIDPRNLIAKAYNREKGTDIKWSDLSIDSFGDNIIPGNTNNTMITVSYGAFGSVTIYYNRYPISDHITWSTKDLLALPAVVTGKVRDLLPQINARFGLTLTASEIEDTTYPLPTGTAFDITITIADSYAFTKGSKFTVSVNAGYKMIDGLCCQDITMTDGARNLRPDIFQVINESSDYSRYGSNRVAPWTLTANVDYTPIAHILRNVGVVDAYSYDTRVVNSQKGFWAQFVAAVKSVDGNPWVNQSAGLAHNLHAALPVYNGPVAGAKGYACRVYASYDSWLANSTCDLTNPKYDNVLVMLAVSGYMNDNMKANFMLFHYND